MVIPFALLCCLRNPLLRGQIAITVLLVASLGALVLTFARSFYVAVAIELGFGFLVAIARGYLPRTGTALILGLAFAGGVAAFPKVYETFMYRRDSVDVRLVQYESSLAQIRENPVLGVGLNNGTGLKRNYIDTSYNPVDPLTQSHTEPTHNFYLGLAADIGIAGMLCFVGFFAVVVRAAWRLGASRPDSPAGFFATAVVIVFAGVATVMMGDPFHEDAVLALAWLYSGIVLGLADAQNGARSDVAIV